MLEAVDPMPDREWAAAEQARAAMLASVISSSISSSCGSDGDASPPASTAGMLAHKHNAMVDRGTSPVDELANVSRNLSGRIDASTDTDTDTDTDMKLGRRLQMWDRSSSIHATRASGFTSLAHPPARALQPLSTAVHAHPNETPCQKRSQEKEHVAAVKVVAGSRIFDGAEGAQPAAAASSHPDQVDAVAQGSVPRPGRRLYTDFEPEHSEMQPAGTAPSAVVLTPPRTTAGRRKGEVQLTLSPRTQPADQRVVGAAAVLSTNPVLKGGTEPCTGCGVGGEEPVAAGQGDQLLDQLDARVAWLESQLQAIDSYLKPGENNGVRSFRDDKVE
jgi:hypothetical protein